MSATWTLAIRLTIPDPVAGVVYSLQDAKNAPVGARVAGEGPLCFDIPIKVSADGKLGGPFVRREGPLRRFVYIAIGGPAGQAEPLWTRRMKIDIHALDPALIAAARDGAVLAADLPGRDTRDGGPACATQAPVGGWRAL
jgi:hypothetical protein